MNRMTIRGAEYPVKKIFSDDFVFTIPRYQRAYAWTTEEAEELLHDLTKAMEGYKDSKDSVEDLPPYFLGSIVLIKGDAPDAQIIDGQQRITTLTMLLAALRSMIKSDYVDSLTAFLCEKGNVITGTPTRYRLRVRESDVSFFQKYIQDEGGVERLKQVKDEEIKSESQRNMRDNTLGFVNELQKLSEDSLTALTQFIINRCFLVIVAVDAPEIDSAYRIFSVLNSRGLDLSYSDILKAEIINEIPLVQQDEYAKKWEEKEILLGSEAFEDLFYNLRAIFARGRLRKGLVEEFHQYVYPGASREKKLTPQQFIDDILVRYADATNYILKANFQRRGAEKEAATINTMFKWLNRLDYNRWMPPVLYYFFEHWKESAELVRFLTDLERLIVYFVMCRVPPFKRMDRYCLLLEAIYRGDNLYAANSPLQLTNGECREFLRGLEGNLYLAHHICKYILLRLDEKLSEGVAQYEYQSVTIEHVLPQRPAMDSEWLRHFPSRDLRDRYVHRLGNLVLLSRGKNTQAENFDFERKKRDYFSSAGGVSPFVITTHVIRHTQWTPTIIEQRQEELLKAAKSLWRL